MNGEIESRNAVNVKAVLTTATHTHKKIPYMHYGNGLSGIRIESLFLYVRRFVVWRLFRGNFLFSFCSHETSTLFFFFHISNMKCCFFAFIKSYRHSHKCFSNLAIRSSWELKFFSIWFERSFLLLNFLLSLLFYQRYY